MATNDEFWERRNSLNNDFFVVGSRDHPATEEQISVYEKASGYNFNGEFKEFLTTYGSLVFEVKAEIWRRPERLEVLPVWKYEYGFMVFGMAQDKEMPYWMTFESKNREALKYNPNPPGQMFFKCNGKRYRAYVKNDEIITEYSKYDASDTEVFSGNLYDFLIKEIDKLEEYYRQMLSENIKG